MVELWCLTLKMFKKPYRQSLGNIKVFVIIGPTSLKFIFFKFWAL